MKKRWKIVVITAGIALAFLTIAGVLRFDTIYVNDIYGNNKAIPVFHGVSDSSITSGNVTDSVLWATNSMYSDTANIALLSKRALFSDSMKYFSYIPGEGYLVNLADFYLGKHFAFQLYSDGSSMRFLHALSGPALYVDMANTGFYKISGFRKTVDVNGGLASDSIYTPKIQIGRAATALRIDSITYGNTSDSLFIWIGAKAYNCKLRGTL
jgi:hypothetical protein